MSPELYDSGNRVLFVTSR